VSNPDYAAAGIVAVCRNGGSCHTDVELEEAARLVHAARAPLWIHLKVGDKQAAAAWLTHELGFHELAVEDALSPNERPALSQFDDYVFLVAPAISKTNSHEEYIEVGFFVSAHSLVSVSEGDCAVVEVWFERWSKHQAPTFKTTADLLHIVIDSIVDGYLPVIDMIEDRIDAIADSIFTGEKGKVYELLQEKRRLLDMRRRIVPLRDVVNGLLRRDLRVIPDKTRPYFQDVYDHASRIAESIDLQRDTLTSLLDVHLSIVSNNLNEVMKKMTVIATVLMSAGLIAGVYGMNFEHMPELKWGGGYPFALGLMVVSSAGILGIFRWKKWI
jgi:magnesium transporter